MKKNDKTNSCLETEIFFFRHFSKVPIRIDFMPYSGWVWSGDAKVLGNLPVPGRPTIWMIVGQGPIALAIGAGGGCLDIFTLLFLFSSLSPSLWETARYRLKYCLKGPLNPNNQPTNQPTLQWQPLLFVNLLILNPCTVYTVGNKEMQHIIWTYNCFFLFYYSNRCNGNR